jgi:hypothetical protein
VLSDDCSYRWEVEDLANLFFDDHGAREVLAATRAALRCVDHDAAGALDGLEAVSLVAVLFAGTLTPRCSVQGDRRLRKPFGRWRH